MGKLIPLGKLKYGYETNLFVKKWGWGKFGCDY